MNKFLSGLLTIGLSLSSLPALAGLGDAEGGTKREFDAYCGEIGKKCKIVFTGDKLIVNASDNITKNQLRKFSSSSDFWCNAYGCKGSGTFLIIYEEAGKESSGTIIFVNHKTYEQFAFALDAFCGSDCRPVGPSMKIEQ